MAQPGDELFVAVRYDAVVPVLVTGRGGTDVERYDDVTITPLPTHRQPKPSSRPPTASPYSNATR